MTAKTTTEKREYLQKLIAEAEHNLEKNPTGYRRKLILLAGLGYIYIFGILLFTTLLVGLFVFGAANSSVFLIFLLKSKLIILLGMVLYVLIKALWVKLDAPDGYHLKRQDYPELYAEIDAIGAQLQAPKIHDIILTSDCNAAISQTPRLGIFGWQKNTLIIGLVMMMSMDKAQFLSVVAHEFGHLSSRHSRFSNWIYRIRTTWMRIMNAFEEAGGWSYFVFGRFFNWYAPYFNAYSFALARANEYEADAIATKITSKQTFVEALTQAYTVPDLVEKHYWSAIEEQVGKSEQVKPDVFTDLYRKLNQHTFQAEERRAVLDKILLEKTGCTDTHPSFKDRISPYTEESSIPGQVRKSAADELLSEKLATILKDFDQDWTQYNRDYWADRHLYLQQSQSEMQVLEQKQAHKKLDREELWKLAIWTEEIKQACDALPYYQQYHQQYSDDTDGQFALGRLLLKLDDEAGIHYLNQAMSNHHAVIPACELIHAYYQKQGDQDHADTYLIKAEQHMDLQDQAENERANLYDDDVYLPDELSSAKFTTLQEQFKKVGHIKAAWICRKQVNIFPDEPVYVVTYEKKWLASQEKVEQQILDTLELPSEYFIVDKNGAHKKFAKQALLASRDIIS